ncbi:hypothetical protein GCK72_011518 [Caenorhabditis remanei]|uniref:Uncharacterized protein n=1 Tax=Caenorhabditis remanei TaxID=31234 RepID=A0A6A5HA35_CAERE|nr:hypothetical protein GCK72_011518 [Caenorhabditis remanei]KAF1763252.1 hypothetical protein GCK72_011518 [Caenorhabditis remanei]
MRLLIVFVVVFGLLIATGQSSDGTSYKFSLAIHCPSGELGQWFAEAKEVNKNDQFILSTVGGTTSDKFVFVEIGGLLNILNNLESLLLYARSDCKIANIDVGIPIPKDKGHHYAFRAYNMEDDNDKTDSEAYEYLFMKYLEKDCAMNECKESAREYVAKGCDVFKNEASQCMKGYDNALPKYCQKDGSSVHSICSDYGSTKMILIIGGAVGAIIVLVLAIGVFFYCRKKKKSKQNMTGTGTMSGSGTLSGTTKQSTATNNFNTGTPTGTPTGASPGAPIPTGVETTTGAQRY